MDQTSRTDRGPETKPPVPMLFITLFRGFATRGPIFTRNLRLQIDCKRLRAILVSTEGNPLIEDARIPGIDTVVLPLVSELTSRNRRLLSATVGEKLRSLGNPIRGGKL